MKGILSDVNVEGQVAFLIRILEASEWSELWTGLRLKLVALEAFGLPNNTSDATIWHLCQDQQLILITANRNHEGPDSLEATIRACNTPKSLPVLTIADADRVLHSKNYADRVVTRLMDYLLEIDRYRGTGRLYLP